MADLPVVFSNLHEVEPVTDFFDAALRDDISYRRIDNDERRRGAILLAETFGYDEGLILGATEIVEPRTLTLVPRLKAYREHMRNVGSLSAGYVLCASGVLRGRDDLTTDEGEKHIVHHATPELSAEVYRTFAESLTENSALLRMLYQRGSSDITSNDLAIRLLRDTSVAIRRRSAVLTPHDGVGGSWSELGRAISGRLSGSIPPVKLARNTDRIDGHVGVGAFEYIIEVLRELGADFSTFDVREYKSSWLGDKEDINGIPRFTGMFPQAVDTQDLRKY